MRGLVCTIALFMVAAGCDRGPATGPARPKVEILATVYPLGELAKRLSMPVGGVRSLVESPGNLAGVRDTAELRSAIDQARFILTAGPEDRIAAERLGLEAREQRLVTPEGTVSAREGKPSGYLWLDPIIVADMMATLREKLCAVAPMEDQQLRRNGQTIDKELRELDRDIRQTLSAVKGKEVLCARPVLGAFCGRYGLVQVAPVDVEEQRMGETEWRELSRAARAGGMGVIFVDGNAPLAVRELLGKRTGLRVVGLEFYGTSAPDGLSTYGAIMRYNAEQIRKGLLND